LVDFFLWLITGDRDRCWQICRWVHACKIYCIIIAEILTDAAAIKASLVAGKLYRNNPKIEEILKINFR
jgi:hypothetical protein